VELGIELPPGLVVVTARERPELWDQVERDGVFSSVWPAYNSHGDLAREYFGALVPRFADFQVLLLDRERGDEVVGRGRTIPFDWDGDASHLPAGIDALGMQAIASERRTSLSALAAEVVPGRQRQGTSAVIIRVMREVAAQHQLAPLVAPVRPSWKERYPLVPIEEYASWVDSAGLPFDPWMRVHVRLGGRILRPEPRSMRITAPVADWEAWTGIAFPAEGSYVFPRGLAPLRVVDGMGDYWEPNVWMIHEVPPRSSDL
jgi:hypothetical protein